MFEGYGLLIDKDKKRYKKYPPFLFFKVGDWAPLLDFKFVAVTGVDGAQRFRSPQTFVNTTTVKMKLFCVYLCIDKKRKVLVRKTKSKQEAITLAKGAAAYLNIDVVNYIKE